MDQLIGRFIAINLMTTQAMLREARRYDNPEEFMRGEFEGLRNAIRSAGLDIKGADTETCRAVALSHLDEVERSLLTTLSAVPGSDSLQ